MSNQVCEERIRKFQKLPLESTFPPCLDQSILNFSSGIIIFQSGKAYVAIVTILDFTGIILSMSAPVRAFRLTDRAGMPKG